MQLTFDFGRSLNLSVSLAPDSAATLNGTVNPNGTATTAFFVVTGPGGFSFNTDPIDCGSGTAAVSVSPGVLAPPTRTCGCVSSRSSAV